MLAPSYYNPKRCLETVYTKQQCSRKHQEGREYCWQHPWAEKRVVAMKEKKATS